MPSAAKDVRSTTRPRAILVAAVLMAGFLGVGARLFFLQVVEHGKLSELALRQQLAAVELPARRGTIFDRRGRDLAVSMEADSLYGVPANVDDPRSVAGRLAPAIGQRERAVEAKLRGRREFVWLARKVAPGVQERVAAAAKGRFDDAIGWLSDCRRYYPNKELAGHVLGFTGLDNRGLEGLEKQYDGFIGGQPGKAVTQRDGGGRRVLTVDEERNSPKSGCDMTLTLDERVQYMVEKELDGLMERCSPLSATAIVMDPRTGEIIAMATRPAFNPNSYQDTPRARWRNRAVTDLYEPGSTFKIVTAAAALEEGVVRPSDVIDCGNGEIEVAGRVIHNAHKEGGRLTFCEVIQKSSNVGTVKVALRLGQERLYKYARAFGFGEKTGVDLPGEASGRLRQPRDWSGVSLASVAIGQEVDVTPLQMLCALNAIANGGWYVRPYIVSDIRTADGAAARRAAAERPRRVISASTAGKLTEILCNVVEEGGTAQLANIPGYQVAGKTGTAQKYDRAIGRYSNEKYMSSFMGFVPAQGPRLSAIVVVDEPRGQHYGGVVAAPAFRNIVEKTLLYMKVPTRLPQQTILVER